MARKFQGLWMYTYEQNFHWVITRDRKFRALEKSPDPGAPGEIGNINPPAPGAPAFRILTPDRGPRGRGMHNITIISEFFSKNNTQY